MAPGNTDGNGNAAGDSNAAGDGNTDGAGGAWWLPVAAGRCRVVAGMMSALPPVVSALLVVASVPPHSKQALPHRALTTSALTTSRSMADN